MSLSVPACLWSCLPADSSIVTNPCDPTNVKQLWAQHKDGTLRASDNYTEQCLTAEIGPPAGNSGFDVFAGALADGSAAVVFYNRNGAAAKASLSISELPGGRGGNAALAPSHHHSDPVDAAVSETAAPVVLNVWGGAEAAVVGGILHSGTVAPHGVAFLRVTP